MDRCPRCGSMRTVVSLADTFVQDRSTCVGLAAVTDKPVGAAGFVVAVRPTTVDAPEAIRRRDTVDIGGAFRQTGVGEGRCAIGGAGDGPVAAAVVGDLDRKAGGSGRGVRPGQRDRGIRFDRRFKLRGGRRTHQADHCRRRIRRRNRTGGRGPCTDTCSPHPGRCRTRYVCRRLRSRPA